MEFSQIFSIIDRLRIQMPLEAITMDILAAKSGVSRASLYRLFGSRQVIMQQYRSHSGVMNLDESLADISSRILQAASKIFLTYGFAASTIEKIAEEAGVGTATIYRYFESKENLIIQVLSKLSPQDSLEFPRLDESQDVQQSLEEFTRTALHFLRQNQNLLKLLLIESAYLTPIQKRMDKLRNRTRDRIAAFFLQIIPDSPQQERQAKTLTITLLGLIASFSFSDAILQSYDFEEEQAAAWITGIILHKIGEMTP
jgi:AcrR family transcriptional regulator